VQRHDTCNRPPNGSFRQALTGSHYRSSSSGPIPPPTCPGLSALSGRSPGRRPRPAGRPAEEPVEQAPDLAGGARVESVQVVYCFVKKTGQVDEQIERAVLVAGQEIQLGPSTRPGLTTHPAQPERTQRHMSQGSRQRPVGPGGTHAVTVHRRSPCRACPSNTIRQTCVSSGGSAEPRRVIVGAPAARCDVSSPVAAYRDTYTVMTALRPTLASECGGLAGIPASPPPSARG